MTTPPPPCPITGEPARRRVQWVSSRLLRTLWRASFGVVPSPVPPSLTRYGLWESPTGLYFFDPPIAGDGDFYTALHSKADADAFLSGNGVSRADFEAATPFVRPDERVLDVGCAGGGFRRSVPRARYTGLEPHTATSSIDGTIIAETVEAHAPGHWEAYDVVTAFQVLEHVPDPLAMMRAAVACLRPGGVLIVSVPCHPSPMTRIPNFVLNAPPHHLSWWTTSALEALCAKLDLTVEEIRELPVAISGEAHMQWMSVLSPIKCIDRHFRAAWSWHLAQAWAHIAAKVAGRLAKPPVSLPPMSLLLVARRR